MKVAIASDHAGFPLKHQLLPKLEALGVAYTDFGTQDEKSVDYPDYALKVGREIAEGHHDLGILVCGTGLGMCIAANKIHGVRAVTAHDVFSARMSRMHNDANVLTLGARVIGPSVAEDIIEAFIQTPFEGGRHQRRVDQTMAIEAEQSD